MEGETSNLLGIWKDMEGVHKHPGSLMQQMVACISGRLSGFTWLTGNACQKQDSSESQVSMPAKVL